MEEDLFLVLGWGSPIGLGIFLVLVGGMLFLIAKADKIKAHTKSFQQEKGIEKKSIVREKLGSSDK